ncbi:MAG: C10 family peptidase [Bacteroidales bacterium]|nr:C10 family peptidase [Bacteroidales bacterium]MCF8332940.1 C10 family peptidase [Bacteroidales bacterium]
MMRKHSLLFTFLLFIAFINAGKAEEVSMQQAQTVAKNFYYETVHTYYSPLPFDEIAFEDTFVKSFEGEPAYYVFNMKPEGFVIVSAEDAFNPILGYSKEGAYSKNRTNEVYESWMASYTEKIDYLRDNDIDASQTIENKWDRYLNGSKTTLTFREKGRDIEPLLTSTWDQDYPYNAFCPEDEDGPGGHALAGCVATAMSMIMYHYKYPEHGYGQNSYYCYPYGTLSADFGSTYYMWDAMSDQISATSPEHSIRGIAQLQYHCGVAVDMNFSPEGSGSQSYMVPSAIQDHFGYSEDATHLQKINYSLSEWQDMIMEDLENNHPLYYSGHSNEGGHAFALDGAQGTDMFHFNFGWSGYMNGYYYLEGDGAVGGYNQNQAMVKNFYPDQEEYPYYCSQDTVPYLGGTIGDGGLPYENYGTNAECSWLLTPPTSQDSVEYFEVDFLDFNLEDGADYLKVYDGATTDAELIGEYTGSELPSSFDSSGDTLLIEFVTDDNETIHDGFRLEFEANRPTYCSGAFQYDQPTGSFDDGSGDMNYLNNSICQYFISPEYANELTINFDSFDLAEGDKLEVYETSPSSLLVTLTGTELPDSYTSSTGSMMLVLVTNNMYAGQGFSLTYSVDNTGNDEKSAYKDLTVYPNPVSHELTIRMDTQQSGDIKATLSSVDGKLVYQDFITSKGGSVNQTIDLSNYDKGVYLLTLETDQVVETRRVIVK